MPNDDTAQDTRKEPTPMYGNNPPQERDERKRDEARARFREDPQMERFLRWKRNDDPRFETLSPSLRTQLGFYESDKEKAR